MNIETGAVYKDAAAITAALKRGEPLAPVSERVVKLVSAGKRAETRAKAKRKRKQAKASKRRNRRD